ncbi:MAG: peptide deformylase [Clostridiaceae bacterium]|jgi:peptide deformylase|nr:peptide deformylase [Clostridiaceae bacterium]
MALRNILIEGDPILRKKSRPVTKWNERLKTLVADMQETMRANSGVGLAAPQVGVLRRVFVMNLGLDEAEDIVAINPRIIEQEGAVVGEEGCLSLPGLVGNVERPQRVIMEAEDLAGNTFRLEMTGLAAVCVCHEIDHLDGILYRDKAISPLVEAGSSSEDIVADPI